MIVPRKLLEEFHISNDSKIAAAVVCGYSEEDPAEKKKITAEFFY